MKILPLGLLLLPPLLAAQPTVYTDYTAWADAAQTSALANGVPANQFQIITENWTNDQITQGESIGTSTKPAHGSISNGAWNDMLSGGAYTSFGFPTVGYGFGMDVSVVSGNQPQDGLWVYMQGNSPLYIPSGYDGFVGLVSQTPMTSLFFTSGPDETTDTIRSWMWPDPPLASTPEPSAMMLGGSGLFLLAIGAALRRVTGHRSLQSHRS